MCLEVAAGGAACCCVRFGPVGAAAQCWRVHFGPGSSVVVVVSGRLPTTTTTGSSAAAGCCFRMACALWSLLVGVPLGCWRVRFGAGLLVLLQGAGAARQGAASGCCS